ncbi:MAG: hypothetical protein AAGJ81_05650 [Verrucomicrobiota bacterium]
MSDEENHLQLLSIFHYILGGIGCVTSFFPIIHLIIGIALAVSPTTFEGGDEVPTMIGLAFALIAGLFIVVGLAGSICVILTGRFIAQRKHYTFCIVIAAIECLFMPFGTILGVFTLVVLMKDSVKQRFENHPTPPEASS